jgi:hypothetical protein
MYTSSTPSPLTHAPGKPAAGESCFTSPGFVHTGTLGHEKAGGSGQLPPVVTLYAAAPA